MYDFLFVKFYNNLAIKSWIICVSISHKPNLLQENASKINQILGSRFHKNRRNHGMLHCKKTFDQLISTIKQLFCCFKFLRTSDFKWMHGEWRCSDSGQVIWCFWFRAVFATQKSYYFNSRVIKICPTDGIRNRRTETIKWKWEEEEDRREGMEEKKFVETRREDCSGFQRICYANYEEEVDSEL